MPNPAQEKLHFKGFISPRYTQVPDELFDDLMAHLSGAELKVLLYVIRRTFGFKKDSDNISLNQICHGITTKVGDTLDKGTGLSLSTVQIAVKGLIEKNTITAIRNRSKEKGDEATTYCLNLVQNLPLTENHRGGLPKIGNGGYRKSVTQNTVIQQTDIQNRNSNSNSKSNISKDNKGHDNFTSVGDLLMKKVEKKKINSQEIPEAIKVAIDEISKEFGEHRNIRSNLTHVLKIYLESEKAADRFISKLYEAKSITKQQKNVKKRMPYFFTVLEDLIGFKNKPINLQMISNY